MNYVRHGRASIALTLSGRGMPWIGAALAMLLTLPSLRAGWIVDDHFHRAVMIRPPEVESTLPSRLDMFRFLDGDPSHNQALMDGGFMPWWTDRNIKGAFWRPVTALTHWIDYRLWPRSPAMMHLHSVAWYGAVVFLLGVFYRRWLGASWVAGVATVLYAIDDAHGLPVGFIANRNALIAAFFGVLTLLLHDRWRHRGSLRSGSAAAIAYALSLLSSEAGLAATAYLFAYAIFMDRAARGTRAGSLVPYAVITIAWRITWSALGYGVSSGMGLYVDPLVEPLSYLRESLHRIPILLAGQLAFPPADLSFLFDPDRVWIHAIVALTVIALLAVVGRTVLRRIPDAGYWITGMLLSLLPISATFASDRLLAFVGIGAMALVARFFEFVRGERSATTKSVQRLGLRAVAGVLLLFHGIVAPVGLALRSAFPTGPPSLLDQWLVRMPFEESMRDRTLVIVNAPMVFYTLHLRTIRGLEGEPAPARVRNLASGIPSVSLERVDDRTLIVRPEGGFVRLLFDRLFRSPLRPMLVGDRIELTGLSIEVTELTPDRRPAVARFTFDVPLEDDSLAWLYWVDGGFQWWTPPAVGASVVLRCPFPGLE